MDKRFNTTKALLFLTCLTLAIVGCDEDSDSSQVEEYKLDNYYQLAESGTWIYADYDDGDLQRYLIYDMKGKTFKLERDCYEVDVTELNSDSTYHSDATTFYSISDDSLFSLANDQDYQEYWDLNNFVSLWSEIMVGDTIVYQHYYSSVLTATFKMILAEENASITVDDITYTGCRVYEYIGRSDRTQSSSIIVSYYAKNYGLVYQESDFYLRGFDEEKTKTSVKKLIHYEQ